MKIRRDSHCRLGHRETSGAGVDVSAPNMGANGIQAWQNRDIPWGKHTYIAIENGHRNSEFPMKNCDFP